MQILEIGKPMAAANRCTRLIVAALCWVLVLVLATTPLKAQQAGPKDTAFLLTEHIYPFAAAVNAQPSVRTTLARYKPLRKIARARNKLLQKDLKTGQLEKAIRDMEPSPEDVRTIIQSLVRLNNDNPEMATFVEQLRTTQVYTWSAGDPDSAFLRKMVENLTSGMAYAAHVYLFGEKPTYGKIDAISIDLKTPEIRAVLSDSLRRWLKNESADLFYDMPLKTALTALQMNGRTEAIWYDPLTEGMNAAPVAAIKNTDFSNYIYSAILVPGLGPEKSGIRLTEGGKARCRMAAREFEKGEAPFLIVSGGHVHPNKTPYCEAVEMKKYMVDSLHMNESSILIEPYARHTTTNLRNATRLIQLTGMPLDKAVLIVTDESQSSYINKGMRKTSLRDLGYTPYEQLKILSATHTVFTLNSKSSLVNPLDPLDP
ncbi:YdcF family protein [Arachidicoccus terrestris]|uniref:YdcF family protein n=1 Tax=Arachidicoccus terrestris TaxID=2875539 RepID=UPI001CC65760|nr:YdcF family protein [Arachidicoccus terrestris]UAY55605.1 YdcF family protein [Arachidicoccus terrestris]